MSKFKVLEGINTFLGIYIVLAYALLWYLSSVPRIFIYLTPVLSVVLIIYHIKMSSDLKKSVLGSGSLLNLRFVSSAGFTLILFLSAAVFLTAGCLLHSPLLFIPAMFFVLNHALYISIDKNQIISKKKKNSGMPLSAAP